MGCGFGVGWFWSFGVGGVCFFVVVGVVEVEFEVDDDVLLVVVYEVEW